MPRVSLEKVRLHFHIGSNMPGYLPEGDVTCTDNVTDAWMIFHDDITRVLDNIEDDDLFLSIDTRRNLISEADMVRGDVLIMIEGYAHWVMSVSEPHADCEVSDWFGHR